MSLSQFLLRIQYSAGRPEFVSEVRWAAMLLWLVTRKRYGEPIGQDCEGDLH